MTERPVGVTDVASGAGVVEYRTRERVVAGNTVAEQYLIPVRERVASFRGLSCSPSFGAPSSTAVVAAISNLAGSAVLVAVRALSLNQAPHTDAVTAILDSRLYLQTAATASAGNVMSKVSVGTGEDAAQTSSASVELRSRYAADGGSSTAITLTVGTMIANLQRNRMHTLANQAKGSEGEPRPPDTSFDDFLRDGPLILRAGQSLAFQTLGTASNAHHSTVTFAWEEYTLP